MAKSLKTLKAEKRKIQANIDRLQEELLLFATDPNKYGHHVQQIQRELVKAQSELAAVQDLIDAISTPIAEVLQELEEIRDRFDAVIDRLRPSPDGSDGQTHEIKVPDGLATMYRKDAIRRVLAANYDLLRPGRALGAMRNMEIREVLNKAGRTDRNQDVDFYLSQMYGDGQVERVEIGLYRAKRHP